MEIKVNISDREWWQLVNTIEDRDVKVSDLAVIGFKEARGVTRDDMIQAFVRAGLPDADIAERLGMFVYQVAGRRRWFGLKANRRPANWGRRVT
ncbi:hypothetical protein GCM10009651_35970 [Microbacterium natoriense]|uniref:hypothetical protein n=1 Tax=Microbacterium natoriense TaxID=284570 RepID=UPI0031D0B4C9